MWSDASSINFGMWGRVLDIVVTMPNFNYIISAVGQSQYIEQERSALTGCIVINFLRLHPK